MMLRRLFLIVISVQLCCCRETIIHNLSESDANRMLAHLDAQHLSVIKEKQADGSWGLSLPREQVTEAIRSLDKHKLLKDELPALSKESGFISSKEQDRFRYERALSREIETTLSALPQVIQARVHLNLPVYDPLFYNQSETERASASVMLITTTVDLSTEQIVALVSGASGIKAESVSVVIAQSSQIQSKQLIIEEAAAPINAVEYGVGEISQDQEQITDKQSKHNLDISESVQDRIYRRTKAFFYDLPFYLIACCAGTLIIFVLVFRSLHKKQSVMV
jgi:type III secretory pathway lipoprotein EscJ